ncbi:Protein transport protein [Dirofilaria immitis]
MLKTSFAKIESNTPYYATRRKLEWESSSNNRNRRDLTKEPQKPEVATSYGTLQLAMRRKNELRLTLRTENWSILSNEPSPDDSFSDVAVPRGLNRSCLLVLFLHCSLESSSILRFTEIENITSPAVTYFNHSPHHDTTRQSRASYLMSSLPRTNLTKNRTSPLQHLPQSQHTQKSEVRRALCT